MLKRGRTLEIINNFGQLVLKLIPILIAAVFFAELARIWLGEDRLRNLMTGKRPWEGRLRAAALGAILPFCECGAFPIMVGLLQAGIPLKLALTFFIISPIVSIPAFLFLMGIFGLQIALLYLIVAIILGLLISTLLSSYGNSEQIIRDKFSHYQEEKCCGGSSNGSTCCSDQKAETSCCGENSKGSLIYGAWQAGFKTLKKIIPYAVAAMFIAAIMQFYISGEVFQNVLGMSNLYGVPIAAAVGIPIYGADCTKISMIAPFLEVTQAVGPGIAFILAGAGTSINGLVFMSSIFNKKFLALFALCIFLSAVFTGYFLAFFA